MYIEFDLQGNTNNEFLLLRVEIVNWARRHTVKFKEKTIKLKHRVTFDHNEMYSFWAMTWNPHQHQIFNQYRIVSDLNNKI